jgi:ABC-type transporter Mla MlaB component
MDRVGFAAHPGGVSVNSREDSVARVRLLRLQGENGRSRRARLAASGELDIAVAERLRAAFATCSDVGDLIVDLRDTSFVDCAALHEVLRGRRLARVRGCRVTILPSAALERLVGYLGGWPAVVRASETESMSLTGGQ